MNYRRVMTRLSWGALVSGLLLVSGCATETHRVVEPPTVSMAGTPYSGPRYTVALGDFNNQSTYGTGIFSNGDVLGSQAKAILETDLEQTNRFNVVDRNNMAQLQREAAMRHQDQALQGAQVVITGAITDFGRRTTGDQELFGILGAGKTQTVYAKVDLNVVDVRTSQVLYSVQGAGEYALSDRELLGFGGAAGYDSIINGKVLNLAIMQAIDKLTAGMANGAWSPVRPQR
ncbi:MAG TPA: CsgG/HfaB family protein [Acidiphilium sp.]|nr:MAG: curli production assembly protein CsgG [Acidiphilium sp. 21-60-14]OYV89840.1 MAG: curli production assembly protein CsgG [Acidiphilium sp. 37-60-79]OZB38484.1 MAG: curli production assembly protein CsgG [Acidiphilium sp. 34-60-192]HQT88257.1 CsgG/HfaB family protein [Acidiphilium sp.]HQU24667.1 CsgG/HfaB family protein [Acidiphilium sp.]